MVTYATGAQGRGQALRAHRSIGTTRATCNRNLRALGFLPSRDVSPEVSREVPEVDHTVSVPGSFYFLSLPYLGCDFHLQCCPVIM